MLRTLKILTSEHRDVIDELKFFRLPDRLVGDDDARMSHHFFAVMVAQAEVVVQPDTVA